MDSDVDAGEVQHSRQNGPHSDLAVRLTGELRHQKGGGAHDGGHDLAAGRGGSLHGAGKFTLVAGLLHHGDGDGAGGDGVAHRGAGHHAAQGGGDDRHLGGAAGSSAGHGVGQADKEVGDAGTLQEGTEDDEHHNELGAHVDGAAEDTVGGVEHGADHLVEGHLQGVGTHQVHKGVHQQDTGHAQNGQAHAPAAKLHQRQNGDEAHDHVKVILHDPGGHADDLFRVDGVEEIGTGAHHQQYDIVPGHMVDAGIAFSGREGQKSDQQDHPHEYRQADLLQGVEEHGIHNAVRRENRHENADHQFGRPLPDTGVGLPVILFHHRFHIGSGAYGGVVLRLSGRNLLLRHLFLKKAHGGSPSLW